jgi:hypothetical protein
MKFLVDIHGGPSGTGASFSFSVFCFPLLIIIPVLLQTHLSPPSEMCSSPGQAAHYQILGLYDCGFIFDPKFGWLVVELEVGYCLWVYEI